MEDNENKNNNIKVFLEQTKIQFNKIYNIKRGEINFDPPITKMLKTYYGEGDESYIYHKNVYILPLNENMVVFVLKKHLLIIKQSDFKEDVLENPIVFKIDYKTIYKVREELKDNDYFLHICQMKDDKFTDFNEIIIVYKARRELLILKHFIEKQIVLTWQYFFETKLPIPPPYIYQCHFFLQKVNIRGKSQPRCIIITNQSIYNVSFNIVYKDGMVFGDNCEFEMSNPKWVLMIESITDMCIKKGEQLHIEINNDKKINVNMVKEKKLNVTPKEGKLDFIFYSQEEFESFIFNVRRIYFSLTKKKYLTVKEINPTPP